MAARRRHRAPPSSCGGWRRRAGRQPDGRHPVEDGGCASSAASCSSRAAAPRTWPARSPRALPAHGWDVTRRLRLAARPRRRARASTPASTSGRSTSRAATRRCTRPTRTGPARRTRSSRAVGRRGLRARTSRAWARALRDAGAAEADVLHLHHLTPLHEAAARVAPERAGRSATCTAPSCSCSRRSPTGRPRLAARRRPGQRRMRRWARALRAGAAAVARPARARRTAARRRPPSAASSAPTASTRRRFAPRDVDRAAHWRHHLVDEPRGLAARRAGRDRCATRAEEVAVALDARRCCWRSGASPRSSALACSCAPSRRARASAAARRRSGPARRLPGGVGGRAPLRRDPRHRRARRLPGRLARARRAARLLRRRRRGRARLGARAVRLVLVEGMACGLPPIAVDRHGPGADRRRGRDGLARRARRRGRPRRRAGRRAWPTPASAAAARRPRGAPRSSAGPGRRSAGAVAAEMERCAAGRGAGALEMVDDLNHRAILTRVTDADAHAASSAPSCGASRACSGPTAAGSAPCSALIAVSARRSGWSRRSCCARSSTPRSPSATRRC